jgi:hypothetical protein
MPNAGVGMKILADNTFFESGYATLFTIHPQLLIEQGDSGTVVTPVFQSFKAFEDNGIGFPGTDISNNSAHRLSRGLRIAN